MLNKIISNLLGRVWVSGKYSSWESAKENSKGYENFKIFDQIKNIYVSKIKKYNFHEFYERDGLLFNKKIKDSELLFFVKQVYKVNKKIKVVDFGGSLGSLYFSNYNFIKEYINEWSIVEQKNFVDFGNKFLKKNNFSFFYDLKKCIKNKSPNTAIFSGSLQYTEKPYNLLKIISKSKIDFILLHNIPFNITKKDQYRVQYVPKKIYDASYPITIFSFNFFLSFLKKNNFKILSITNLKSPFFKISYKSLIIQKM